jgi:hypothetical protein
MKRCVRSIVKEADRCGVQGWSTTPSAVLDQVAAFRTLLLSDLTKPYSKLWQSIKAARSLLDALIRDTWDCASV